MFWRTAGRLILIPIAFLIAVLVAAAVATTLGLERLTHEVHGADPTQTVDAAFVWLDQGLSLLAGLTLVPALGVVIVGEVARIRSWLYYVIGSGLALAVVPLLGRAGQFGSGDVPSTALLQVLATAGFCGGLVYWLLAGRNA